MDVVNGSADVAGETSADNRRLLDALAAEGDLTDEEWRRALEMVPRQWFVPDVAWATPQDDDAAPHRIDRTKDEAEWLAAVYSDTGIVTHIDDGATDPGTGDGLFTSSVSAPGIVCQFLELLDARDRDKVLEIGTGSGWTAALLAWRVGADRVVTVEIDPQVAERARSNLTRFGLSPTVIVADGADGTAAWAPFDRVHVACGIARVPYAWVRQTRKGGVIVAPFQPGYGFGHKLRLDVLGDGTAVGRFFGPAGYMMMRAQRPKRGQLASFLHHEDEADHTVTTTDPRPLADLPAGGELAVSALAPGIRCQLGRADDGSEEATLWLLETTPDADVNGSWALVEYVPGQHEYEVIQYGKRRLWDEVREAYLTWAAWGRPGGDRFGLTVTPEQQDFWLDKPSRLIGPTSAGGVTPD